MKKVLYAAAVAAFVSMPASSLEPLAVCDAAALIAEKDIAACAPIDGAVVGHLVAGLTIGSEFYGVVTVVLSDGTVSYGIIPADRIPELAS